jgi:hypothetical protein
MTERKWLWTRVEYGSLLRSLRTRRHEAWSKECRETLKCGHDSRGIRNKVRLCWRAPADRHFIKFVRYNYGRCLWIMDLENFESNWTWSSHIGDFKNCCVLEREAVQCDRSLPTFLRNVLLPCSGSKNTKQAASSCWLAFLLVSLGVVRLSPLGTSATNWPILPAPNDTWR